MPAARFAWLRRNLKFRYGILGYRGETGISRQTGDVHFGRSDTFKSFLEKSRVLHAAAFLPQLCKKSHAFILRLAAGSEERARSRRTQKTVTSSSAITRGSGRRQLRRRINFPTEIAEESIFSFFKDSTQRGRLAQPTPLSELLKTRYTPLV
jgi:hypothetical protein